MMNDKFKRLAARFFGLDEHILDSTIEPQPGGVIRVESVNKDRQKAMYMVANAAVDELNIFLDRQKDLRLAENKHFKGPGKFKNEADEDLKKAYLSLLKTLLKETMDEIERTEA